MRRRPLRAGPREGASGTGVAARAGEPGRADAARPRSAAWTMAFAVHERRLPGRASGRRLRSLMWRKAGEGAGPHGPATARKQVRRRRRRCPQRPRRSHDRRVLPPHCQSPQLLNLPGSSTQSQEPTAAASVTAHANTSGASGQPRFRPHAYLPTTSAGDPLAERIPTELVRRTRRDLDSHDAVEGAVLFGNPRSARTPW